MAIEVNFLDRVPTHAGRVTLTPVEGEENTYDMARADEPTVNGTALNKVTFDSITQSRLTGRYYIPTVTQAQVGAALNYTVNPIPTTGWTNNSFTRSTNGRYIATCISGGGNYPSYAFEENSDRRWASPNSTLSWINIEFPEFITLRKVKLRYYLDSYYNNPVAYLKGSTNGITWDTLLTINQHYNNVLTEYTITDPGEYKHYRLEFSFNSTNIVNLFDFKPSSYDMRSFSNAYTISEGVPSSWTIGQKISIEIPSTANTAGITENKLNNITVNTILQPSRRYELRYNGTSFVAKEV